MDAFFAFATEHAFWATLMVVSAGNAVRGTIVGLTRAVRGVPAVQVCDGKVKVRR